MLILTRNVTQTIRIGDDIEIAILRAKGNQVRIGVSAPAHFSVHREEVYQRIQDKQLQPS